jgi:DNA-binding response OmpR family regulator
MFIIEDDRVLSSIMKEYFEGEGFAVTLFYSGLKTCEEIINQQPDIVILDIDLPDIDGIEVCRKARKGYKNPIIMLTGNECHQIEISSLNHGADKFIRKPTRLHVLLAHIYAALRRSECMSMDEIQPTSSVAAEETCQFNFDTNKMLAICNGEPVHLTHIELQILSTLIEREGECVSRDELHRLIRGFEYDGFDRTIDLKISDLRKKLSDDQIPYKLIRTVRGQGYTFCDTTATA